MKKINLIILFVFATIPLLVISQISHTVNFSSKNLSFVDEVASNNITYTKIELSGFYQISDTGMPALPVKSIKLIIPHGQTVDNISLLNVSVETFSTNYWVFPAQQPIPTCIGCPIPEFVNPDPDIYNSENAWPAEPIKVVHQGYFDGNNNIVTLEICPFEYYPSTGQLNFFSSMDITLGLTSGYSNGISNINRLSKNQIIYDEILAGLVENKQDVDLFKSLSNIIESISSTDQLPTYEYVIITPAEYVNSFTDFIEWKTKKGINIGIVTKEDILNNYLGDEIFPGDEIYDDAGKIRQYLYESYQNGTVWALLVGDKSVMPIRYGYAYDNTTDGGDIIPTDLYFADFTGNWNVDHDDKYGEPNNDSPDYLPEIFVGRLLCSSSQDVSNWVQKVLIYEKNPGNGDFSYLTESFMFQADEMQSYGQADSVANHLPMFNHVIWEEMPSYNSINPTFPKGADIIAEMNSSNYGLMSWFGHGGTGGQNSGVTTLSSGTNSKPYWKLDAEDAFEFYDVVPEENDGLDNLTNFNYPFIIYSISCDITPFDITKSVGNNGARNCGESFTVNNLAGGIAFLGNTRSGWLSSSYELFKKFADILTQSATEPIYSHIGVAELISKHNNSHHYIKYSHNLIGEPETQIWTASPQFFTVGVNPPIAISNINNYFEVTVNNLTANKRATVCLYKENEIFAVQLIEGDANNQAVAVFNNILPVSLGEISVTVTSHNFIPSETTIPIEDECAITIDSDELWETDKLMNCDVIVESGVVLTIESIITIFPEAKIIIKPGARLIIDGGTLTNACSEPWQGIEVWGNSTASQIALPGQPNPQGKLILKNGAVIENAHNAVTLWKPGDYNTTGGIIIANDAVFRNNRRSVEFMSYQNFHPLDTLAYDGNVSYFTNCTFEVDENYQINSPFHAHVTLWDVSGVQFKGNTFQSSLEDTPGKGIYSIDASYKLIPWCSDQSIPCQNLVPNRFIGFDAAIEASASVTGPLRTIFVDSAQFINNGYGIKLSSLNNASITNSVFEIGNYTSHTCTTDFGIGIELSECDGYLVEGNHFSLAADNSGEGSIGIRVFNDNSPPEVNEIYRNNFNGLNRGNLAEGINISNTTIEQGLVYQCNQNTDNYCDFHITGEGIAGHQGSLNIPAGNTFSFMSDVFMSPRHIANFSTNHIDYYYSSARNQEPLYFINTTKHPTVNFNSCPSSFGGGSGQINLLGLSPDQQIYFAEQSASSRAALNSLSALYASLVDGGSTTSMLTAVETALPGDMWDLRAQLLGGAPHLSKEVLKKAANRTDVLPESIIFELLSTNPDELKDAELIEFLQTKSNPLPEEMIEVLIGLRDNITYKTILQSQIGQYGLQQFRADRALLHDLVHNHNSDLEGIRNLLAAAQSLPMDMQLVELFMQERKTEQALSLAAMLPQLYSLSNEELEEYNRFVSLKQLQADIWSEGRSIFELEPSEKSLLFNLMDESQGLAGTQARNILAFIGDYEYCDCPAILEDELKSKAISDKKVQTLSAPSLNVRPNPANTWVSFGYTLSDEKSQAVLEIYDAAGKTIHQAQLSQSKGEYVWDTRQLLPGTYYYSVKAGGSIKTGKLVIIK